MSKGVKDRRRDDVLVLFVLCLITGTDCFVHVKGHKYWTSLKETPMTHLECIQRCNIHLSYLGQGVFAEHLLRTEKVSYKLFGIDLPVEVEDKKTVVIGTLTSDENSTLDKLLKQSQYPVEILTDINPTLSLNVDTQCNVANKLNTTKKAT